MSNENTDYKVVEKQIKKWKYNDKHSYPHCGKKIGMPDYTCEDCKIILKLKMKF